MSKPKVPTQFPWIVAGVVVAHAILAVFLFGGGKDPYPEAAAAARNSHPQAQPAPAPVDSSAQNHPFGSAAIEDKAFSAKDNPEFKSRFPKRVPLQSELSGAVLPDETPAAAGDTEKIAIKERSADVPPNNASAVMSAVAAAKVSSQRSNLDATDEEESETDEDLPESANRLRMIDKEETFPVPQPISVKRVAPRPEPVSVEMTAPSGENGEAAAVSRPAPASTVEEPVPVVPQSGRKFRVVKPLPR